MDCKLNKLANTVFNNKIWYYIQNVIIMGLFMYCVKGLTDYDNEFYQTWKNQAAAKAIFAFMAIVFLVRKVRLINWQSLVGTLLFIPFFIERMHFWRESPDILNILKPQMIAEWLALMIIIDMILYKNINNIFKNMNILLLLYFALAFGMIYRRNGQTSPIILIFPMLLFMLIKMDKERWEWFLKCFINGWFGIFTYVVVRSVVENPYDGRRYYGYFLDIGPFGIFMTCALVMAIFALMYSKEKYGRKSIFYAVSVIWIAVAAVMLWIIDTRTILAGTFFALAFMFVFARKDTSKKQLIKRGLLIGGVIVVIIALVVIGLFALRKTSNYDWYASAGDGLLSPIYMHACRLAYAMNEMTGDTFGEQLISVIDKLSSGRISIAKAFSPYFNFEGNGPLGLELENGYWAFNAHNNFVQILIEYGYISLIEMSVLVIASLVQMIRKYLKSEKKAVDYLPILWISAMLGVWCGEVSSLYYPATFFGMMFIVRNLIPADEKHNGDGLETKAETVTGYAAGEA